MWGHGGSPWFGRLLRQSYVVEVGDHLAPGFPSVIPHPLTPCASSLLCASHSGGDTEVTLDKGVPKRHQKVMIAANNSKKALAWRKPEVIVAVWLGTISIVNSRHFLLSQVLSNVFK